MIITTDEYEIEANGVCVYTESGENSTLTSYAFLEPEARQEVENLTKEIERLAKRLIHLVDNAPSDGGYGSVEAALNEGYTMDELQV